MNNNDNTATSIKMSDKESKKIKDSHNTNKEVRFMELRIWNKSQSRISGLTTVL